MILFSVSYIYIYIYIVACQPIVGLRNKALLGSRPLNASRTNTRSATAGEAVFAPCRAERSRAKRCCTAGAMTSHVFTWLPGDEPPSCQAARGMGDVRNSTVEQRNDRC
jgi:hypothetical protein